MKSLLRPAVLGLILVGLFLGGCDDFVKKKAQAEQDKTREGMRVNPGAYEAKTLDTLMGTPTPTPKTDDQK